MLAYTCRVERRGGRIHTNRRRREASVSDPLEWWRMYWTSERTIVNSMNASKRFFQIPILLTLQSNRKHSRDLTECSELCLCCTSLLENKFKSTRKGTVASLPSATPRILAGRKVASFAISASVSTTRRDFGPTAHASDRSSLLSNHDSHCTERRLPYTSSTSPTPSPTPSGTPSARMW